MPKCTICEAEAPYAVKGTSTFYCEEHAIEFFGDITYLVKAEAAASALIDIVDQYNADSNINSDDTE
jgi:hypothetical protein